MTQTTAPRTLAERLTIAAEENFGIDPEFIDFPKILVPSRGADGNLYVEDHNNVVRYNITTGEFTTTRDFEEKIEVANQNQMAAATLEQMVLG